MAPTRGLSFSLSATLCLCFCLSFSSLRGIDALSGALSPRLCWLADLGRPEVDGMTAMEAGRDSVLLRRTRVLAPPAAVPVSAARVAALTPVEIVDGCDAGLVAVVAAVVLAAAAAATRLVMVGGRGMAERGICDTEAALAEGLTHVCVCVGGAAAVVTSGAVGPTTPVDAPVNDLRLDWAARASLVVPTGRAVLRCGPKTLVRCAILVVATSGEVTTLLILRREAEELERGRRLSVGCDMACVGACVLTDAGDGVVTGTGCIRAKDGVPVRCLLCKARR